MTTITLSTIIDHLVDVVEGLTPSLAPSSLFTRNQAPNPPLPVADADVSARVRRFDLRRAGAREALGTQTTDVELVAMPLLLTVAYPAVPKLYSYTELDELEALVESDAAQIYNAIFSIGAIAGPGHRLNRINDLGLDQGSDRVWLQAFAIEAQFYIAR